MMEDIREESVPYTTPPNLTRAQEDVPPATSSFIPATDINTVLFKDSFLAICPLLLVLCSLIIILNSFILPHYIKNRSSIVNVLFLLISISDILTALGVGTFAAGILLWAKNQIHYDTAMLCCFVVYKIVGLVGYSSSILLNTMLAVLRAVNICYPWHEPKLRYAILAGILYLLLIISLTGYDILVITVYTTPSTFHSYLFIQYTLSSLEAMHNFPGQMLAMFMVDSLYLVVLFSIMSVLYIIPVCLVMTSMVAQVVIGEKRARERIGTESLNNWVSINTTVFILASIFLMLNGAVSIYTIVIAVVNPPSLTTENTEKAELGFIMGLAGVVSTVLPLLSVLLFPSVLLARNRTLRTKVFATATSYFRRNGSYEQLE